jgi:Flp pilus assembly protein TadG
MTERLRRFARDEQGRVTAFVVIVSAACLLCAGLVLDGGMALAAKVRAIGQAQEAARAGAQQLDLATYRDTSSVTLQPAAAITAAQRYLASVGATGTATVAGNTVSVVVTAQQPTELLGMIGVREIPVAGQGHAEPDQGPGGP